MVHLERASLPDGGLSASASPKGHIAFRTRAQCQEAPHRAMLVKLALTVHQAGRWACIWATSEAPGRPKGEAKFGGQYVLVAASHVRRCAFGVLR